MAITTRAAVQRAALTGKITESRKVHKSKRSAARKPALKPLSALEESNLLYEASIAAARKEKKHLPALPISPVLCEREPNAATTVRSEARICDFDEEIYLRLPADIDIKKASNDTLKAAFRDCELFDAATVELVERGVYSAYSAWTGHFAGSGVPESWLKKQEDELRDAVERSTDMEMARGVVFALKARYRAQVPQ